MDYRITNKAPYGQHIPLTCKNHPELRWHTKNISPIGCRSIFFNLMGTSGGQAECDCPASDLVPSAADLDDLPVVPE